MNFAELTLDMIEPSASNPRRHWNKTEDAELTASISTHGILTPLLVRPMREAGKYQIAAGHRRFEAAKKLGLVTVPVQVREMEDPEYFEILHVENLQRQDLNPIEEARAYASLMEEFGLSQSDVAERVGKERSTVANSLRLLQLSARVQDAVRSGLLTMGHARALAGLPH